MLALASSSRVSSACPHLARRRHSSNSLTLAPSPQQSLARTSAPRSIVGSWVAQRGLATAQDPYDVVVIGGGALASPLVLLVANTRRISATAPYGAAAASVAHASGWRADSL